MIHPDWYASLSPKDRRSHKDPLAVPASFRLLAGWCLLLLLPSMVICTFRIAHGARVAPLLLGFTLSAGFAYVLVASLVSRSTSTLQAGVHLRRAEPIRYWIEVTFLVAVYVLLLLGCTQINA